ncbi:alpha/beta-hydrolase [Mycena metata]|uniref:Alpha/beta-hydrolase n=1 Tax=Mycena metata TaxID=1033252 RepID=A0AAD7JN03_9AGAR|nr:alpha/beta-hydrolase [Mycena metata]
MAFRFRRQPQKSIYILICVLIILFFRLPSWALRNLLPSWRPRRKWSFGRALIVEIINAATAIMSETHFPTPESLDKLALSANKTGFVWVEPTPDLITGEVLHFAKLNGVAPATIGGFWYGLKGLDNSVGQRASPDEKLIYHLHGNGGPSFSPSTVTIDGYLSHFPQINRVFALEYRLASGPPFPAQNPFPAALVDVIAGYHYLIHKIGFAPQNIIVSGDSAGGILTYQLARYLATVGSSVIPQAGALLLLSPSADSGLHAPPGSSMHTNRRADYVRTWFESAYVPPALLGKLPREELNRPWLSPGSPVLNDADVVRIFTGFPPTFILAGEAEMSRDAMRTLRDRMRGDMGEEAVRYVEIADAPHDFVGISIFEPERTAGLEAIAIWLDYLDLNCLAYLLLNPVFSGGRICVKAGTAEQSGIMSHLLRKKAV